jgi:hypothetical protein
VTVVDLYTIQIIDDGGPYEYAAHSRRHEELPALIAEAEENLSDLLPAGYRARIRRWDHPGTEEDDE